MATIDNRYILSPALQQIFRDKDSGLPLRNGRVEFYRDISRIDAKDVFIQSGVPGAYVPENIGNIVTLSQAGAFSYLNNDVAILYFPFFQTEDGEILDKYFIRVFDEFGVEQFTREGWPQGLSEDDEEDTTFTNYIADGQFWNHRNLPILPNTGNVSPGVNILTYGGGRVTNSAGKEGSWIAFVDPTSETVDTVIFERFNSAISTPEANPRYALRYKSTAPDISDTQKHLIYRIVNVNFASSTTEFYTFQFEANSNLTGATVVNLKLLKTFGVGGSPADDVFITPFTIQPGWNKYTANFVMGDNDGKNLGPIDDDMLEIYLEIPTDQISDISYDNFILRDGSFVTLKHPDVTPRQNQSQTLTMPVPAHDLSDEGKLPMLTPSGFRYCDIVQPGDWKFTFSVNPQVGWIILTTDGESLAKTSGATFNGEKYRALYVVLHNVATALIQGGIKGDANTDFDSNLFLAFPPMLGRVAGGAGQGTALTLRANGANTGQETVSLVDANNGPHSHAFGGLNGMYDSPDGNVQGGSQSYCFQGGSTTQASGSGTPHENMQPTFFSNITIYYGEA